MTCFEMSQNGRRSFRRLVVVPDQRTVFPRPVPLLSEFVHCVARTLDLVTAGFGREIEAEGRGRKCARAVDLDLVELHTELDLIRREKVAPGERHDGFSTFEPRRIRRHPLDPG